MSLPKPPTTVTIQDWTGSNNSIQLDGTQNIVSLKQKIGKKYIDYILYNQLQQQLNDQSLKSYFQRQNPVIKIRPKPLQSSSPSFEKYSDSDPNGLKWIKQRIAPFHQLTENDKTIMRELIKYFSKMKDYAIKCIQVLHNPEDKQNLLETPIKKWINENVNADNYDKINFMLNQYKEIYLESAQVLLACLKQKRTQAQTTISTFKNTDFRYTCEGYILLAMHQEHIIMSVTVWKRNASHIEQALRRTVQEHALIGGNLLLLIEPLKKSFRNISLLMHSFSANVIGCDFICSSPYEKMREIMYKACKENDIPIVYGNNWMTKQSDEIDHCTAFGCNLLITNNQNMKNIWINREAAAAQRKISRGG